MEAHSHGGLGLYVIDQNVADRTNAIELELSSYVTEGKNILQEESKRLRELLVCNENLLS